MRDYRFLSDVEEQTITGAVRTGMDGESSAHAHHRPLWIQTNSKVIPEPPVTFATASW
jgi:hypothetical protein